jgi:hypothetical protein
MLLICLVLAWLCFAFMGAVHIATVGKSAYAQGRRAGLKAAAAYAADRAEIATWVAPEGQLAPAMLRAQMGKQIETGIRDMIKEIK